MRKKLYDFSVMTGIITVLAYLFLFTMLLFTIFESDRTNWFAIITLVLLVVSFGFIIWYYVFLAVTITDKGIVHGKKFIDKKDAKWTIEYNSRFRYNEIIFYSKYINYEKLNKKEFKKQTIVVQYFPKYEAFLNEYFKNSED